MLLVSFIGCDNEKTNILNQKLAVVETKTYFSLDSLQQGNWDVCYLVRPYDDVDSLLQKLKVSGNHSELIRNNSIYDDGVITLLFVKDDSIIDVQTVSIAVMDFATLPDSINHFYPASKLMMNIQREITDITPQQ